MKRTRRATIAGIGRGAVVLSAVVLVGCPSQRQEPPNSRTNARGSDSEHDDTPSRSKSMPEGFDKAYQAYREHTARVLGAPLDQIEAGPGYEKAASEDKNTVGKAWSMSGHRAGAYEKTVRGWVMADGAVINLEQNLGALCQQAGFWDEKPALDAGPMAERLVWAMGMNHRVLIEPESNIHPPVFTRNDDGSGTFVFFSTYREPGPGGAGGGPESISKVTVTLTADHKATLEKVPFAIP